MSSSVLLATALQRGSRSWGNHRSEAGHRCIGQLQWLLVRQILPSLLDWLYNLWGPTQRKMQGPLLKSRKNISLSFVIPDSTWHAVYYSLMNIMLPWAWDHLRGLWLGVHPLPAPRPLPGIEGQGNRQVKTHFGRGGCRGDVRQNDLWAETPGPQCMLYCFMDFIYKTQIQK